MSGLKVESKLFNVIPVPNRNEIKVGEHAEVPAKLRCYDRNDDQIDVQGTVIFDSQGNRAHVKDGEGRLIDTLIGAEIDNANIRPLSQRKSLLGKMVQTRVRRS